jgi:predicted nucleotidyltransferase
MPHLLSGLCLKLHGEQTPSSDVDIIVVFDEKADVSLIGYIRIQYELETIFGRKVDLVEEGSLLPFAVESANRDRKLIYERAS